jgi:MFS transporter, FSR family, fosmidomycin resistance protein
MGLVWFPYSTFLDPQTLIGMEDVMGSLLKNVTLWSLTLGHFSVDMLSGAMPIVAGLYLRDSLGLSLSQVGLLMGIYVLTSSLTQPLFGYLSDLYGGRWFAVGGLIWLAVLQGSLGFMPTFGLAVVVALFAGLGVAAFHPQGASGANIASGASKTAGIAMFMLGGNGGFAVGPILASLILGYVGIRGTAFMGLVGLLIAPFLYFLTGQAQASAPTEKKKANWKIELNPLFSMTAIAMLILVMSLRAMSQSAMSSFMPQFFVDVAQFSKTEASLLSTLMLSVLALGTLVGGMLADRIGGVKVMAGSMILSTPLLILMFWLGDWRAFWVAPFVGFVTGAAWPSMLVLAQALFSKNMGVGSGVALGFVFAMGGIGLQISGWLAEPERLGLTTVMLILSVVPLATAGLVFFLPTLKKGEIQAPSPEPRGVVKQTN